jgi:Ca-activated chloride channel family protein
MANRDTRESTGSMTGEMLGAGEAEGRIRHPGAWLEWLMLVGYAAATAIAIGCALGIVVALTASAAMAAPAIDAEATRSALQATEGRIVPAALAGLPRVAGVEDAEGAGLLLATGEGLVVAPVQATSTRMKVTGSTVRSVVTQRFTNPSDESLEGVFVFPLPDDGAVDHVRMRVGERAIEGRIEDREQARESYERAKAQGQQGSLVEQQRPNLFTARVANIAPWSTVEVSIEYQQTLALRDGAWRLRIPALFDPRGDDVAPSPAPAMGVAPAVSLVVDIDPGMPISRPVSGSHEVLVIEDRAASEAAAATGAEPTPRYQVQLKPGTARPELDFELEWQPLPGHAPAAMLPIEKHGDNWYAMLMLTPPASLAGPGDRAPREVQFVVDASASMAGAPLEQAKAALRFGLERLGPGDRFNLLRFGDRRQALFDEPRPFDARSARQARAWIAELEAGGGDRDHEAIERALAAPLRDGTDHQVVFIGDGGVDREDELLQAIAAGAGARRLFTVGVGSASNSWFMGKAAEAGRGTFTRIARIGEVERRMAELFAKLGRPLVTGIQIAFDGAQPLDPLPVAQELHAGEPLIVRARFARRPTGATVSGWLGERRWEGRVDARATEGTGLHVLWARHRIDMLQDQLRFAAGSEAERSLLRDEIRQLGLTHHLVTPYTSLVAIDESPARQVVSQAKGSRQAAAASVGWEHIAALAPGQMARLAAAGREIAIGLGILLFALGMLRIGSARQPRRADPVPVPGQPAR